MNLDSQFGVVTVIAHTEFAFDLWIPASVYKTHPVVGNVVYGIDGFGQVIKGIVVQTDYVNGVLVFKAFHYYPEDIDYDIFIQYGYGTRVIDGLRLQ